ncbi:hypothetical protein B0T22DRAFT_38440 [Podospora appendiculata]|uniref:Clr5 domain-containing protein n=1 Tax=Podospora appendiculata TaxID=314037 RepID=A0AAE0XH50_9PEZI|nr:hypothetical protein B0T22DRAFT_38440 [Podospora appendiculata]
MRLNHFSAAKSHVAPVLSQSHLSQAGVCSGSGEQAAAALDPFETLPLQSCVLVPKSRDHWESRKPIIRYLYLESNLPLREVMKIMRDKYHFRATIRMYKRKFKNWEWVKYSPRPAIKQRGLGQGQVDGDASDVEESQHHLQSHPVKSSNSALFPRKRGTSFSQRLFSHGLRLNKAPLDDELTRLKTNSLWNTRILLDHCFGDQARHLTDTARHSDIVGTLQSGFRLLSVPGSDSGSDLDYEIGRMLLSRAFRMIDELVRSFQPDTFFFVCFRMPAYIIKLRPASRSREILRIYVEYVAELCHARLPHSPLASSMAGLRHLHRTAPEQLPHHLQLLFEILEDGCCGPETHAPTMNKEPVTNKQPNPSNHSPDPDPNSILDNQCTIHACSPTPRNPNRILALLSHAYTDLETSVVSALGTSHPLVLARSHKLLTFQHQTSLYLPSFLPLARRTLRILGDTVQHPPVLVAWSGDDALTKYCDISFALAHYFDTIAPNPEASIAYYEKALSGKPKPLSVDMSMRMAEKLAKEGRAKEARIWTLMRRYVQQGSSVLDLDRILLGMVHEEDSGEIVASYVSSEQTQRLLGFWRRKFEQLRQGSRYMLDLRNEEEEEAGLLVEGAGGLS